MVRRVWLRSSRESPSLVSPSQPTLVRYQLEYSQVVKAASMTHLVLAVLCGRAVSTKELLRPGLRSHTVTVKLGSWVPACKAHRDIFVKVFFSRIFIFRKSYLDITPSHL